MSDRENPPEDLFDAVCRLDDLAEWLEQEGYIDEKIQIQKASSDLKGYIVIRLKGEAG
jgi:hypothetical protein